MGEVPIRCSFSLKRLPNSSAEAAVMPRAPPVKTHTLPGRTSQYGSTGAFCGNA